MIVPEYDVMFGTNFMYWNKSIITQYSGRLGLTRGL